MSDHFVAGAAVRSIMPTARDFDNALHAPMSIRLDERGSPLAAKVLIMTCRSRSLMLVALDTVRIPGCSADVLRQAIGAACRLPAESIVISCTHSHSTPQRRTYCWPGLAKVYRDFTRLQMYPQKSQPSTSCGEGK